MPKERRTILSQSVKISKEYRTTLHVTYPLDLECYIISVLQALFTTK